MGTVERSMRPTIIFIFLAHPGWGLLDTLFSIAETVAPVISSISGGSSGSAGSSRSSRSSGLDLSALEGMSREEIQMMAAMNPDMLAGVPPAMLAMYGITPPEAEPEEDVKEEKEDPVAEPEAEDECSASINMKYWKKTKFMKISKMSMTVTASTLEDCMDECIENDDCNVFIFDSELESDNCHLTNKLTKSNMAKSNSYTSGIKCNYVPAIDISKPADKIYRNYIPKGEEVELEVNIAEEDVDSTK